MYYPKSDDAFVSPSASDWELERETVVETQKKGGEAWGAGGP